MTGTWRQVYDRIPETRSRRPSGIAEERMLCSRMLMRWPADDSNYGECLSLLTIQSRQVYRRDFGIVRQVHCHN
jgi:hypothetical protein